MMVQFRFCRCAQVVNGWFCDEIPFVLGSNSNVNVCCVVQYIQLDVGEGREFGW